MHAWCGQMAVLTVCGRHRGSSGEYAGQGVLNTVLDHLWIHIARLIATPRFSAALCSHMTVRSELPCTTTAAPCPSHCSIVKATFIWRLWCLALLVRAPASPRLCYAVLHCCSLVDATDC